MNKFKLPNLSGSSDKLIEYFVRTGWGQGKYGMFISMLNKYIKTYEHIREAADKDLDEYVKLIMKRHQDEIEIQKKMAGDNEYAIKFVEYLNSRLPRDVRDDSVAENVGFYKKTYCKEQYVLRVGLRFGDNDFGGVFLDAMSSILRYDSVRQLIKYYLDNKPNKQLVKKEFVKYLVNSIDLAYYINDTLRNVTRPDSEADVIESLEFQKITSQDYCKDFTDADIYIGSEIDEYVQKVDGWDNGEFFVVEVTLDGVVLREYTV